MSKHASKEAVASSFSSTIIIKTTLRTSTTFAAPNTRSYDSDRSSRDDKVKSMGGFSSGTAATTPESITAKTPTSIAGDSTGEDSFADRTKPRRPIGGVAVLPPMEMKRIAEDRPSPASTVDRKSPENRNRSPISIGDRDSLERKWKQRESRIQEEVGNFSLLAKLLTFCFHCMIFIYFAFRSFPSFYHFSPMHGRCYFHY